MLSTEFTLPVKYADFAAGLVYGLTGDNHLNEIQHCFQTTDPMRKDLTEAIDAFKHLDFLSGVKDIGDIVWQLPQAFSACKNMENDIHAIEDWATIFKDPIRLMSTVSSNFLKHGAELKDDVVHSRGDWTSGNWFKAGSDIADACVALLGPINPEIMMRHGVVHGVHGGHLNGLPPPEAIPYAVAGLVYGLTGDNHLDEITHCFQATDPMRADFLKVVDDVKHFNILGAVSDFGDIILQLPFAFKACTGMDEDIHAIEDWATIFKDPLRLMKTVSMNYLEHGVEIQHDIA